VVDFYGATVLAGDAQAQPVDEAADGEALAAAVDRLWQWSNWEQLRRELTVTAVVLSDVFLKVAERAPSAEEPATAVYMQSIAPQTVRWWDADERGFLTGIRIDTPRLTSVFSGEERRHVLVEVWRKEWPDGSPSGVRYYEIGPNQLLDDTRLSGAVRGVTFEELGYDFIPIVWARLDTPWRRQVAHIDRYNALAWLAARLNRPLAVVEANATDEIGRPSPPPLGAAEGLEALYTEEGDGALGVLQLPGMATMQWSSSPIDFGAMNVALADLKETITDGLPEYRVATLRGIQLATETLQLLMNQAEQRSLTLRAGLERALARAQMMAISIAQVAGVAPEVFARERIGTYEDGRIEHVFAPRPVFARTALARATEAALHIQNGVGLSAAYRLAGYTEEEATMAEQVDAVTGMEQ
jgi:hypothetical protein